MKNKTCPVTGKPIAKRYPVHGSVFEACLKSGAVRKNPREGTLRKFVYTGR